MRPPRPRLPRRFVRGFRHLDLPFLRFVALSLVAHASLTFAAVSSDDELLPSSPSAEAVGFVLSGPGQAALPLPAWPPGVGVHEIIGTAGKGHPEVGDMLAAGGLDEDLTAVLSRVPGVRLPRPGERPALRLTENRRVLRPGEIDRSGCGLDPQGRSFCICMFGSGLTSWRARAPSAR